MADFLEPIFPVRYSVWLACGAGLLLSMFMWVTSRSASGLMWALSFMALMALMALIFCDVRQTKHSILRNYPVIGHLRFLFEFVRPEIRQYFIEADNDAAPFSRQPRSLVCQRAKGEPDKQPFSTQLDVGAVGYEWINHSLAPTTLPTHDFRVVIGENTDQPDHASVFNISAMSFGTLSANAILALNAGAKKAALRTTPAKAPSADITAKTVATWCGKSARSILVAATMTAVSTPTSFLKTPAVRR